MSREEKKSMQTVGYRTVLYRDEQSSCPQVIRVVHGRAVVQQYRCLCYCPDARSKVKGCSCSKGSARRFSDMLRAEAFTCACACVRVCVAISRARFTSLQCASEQRHALFPATAYGMVTSCVRTKVRYGWQLLHRCASVPASIAAQQHVQLDDARRVCSR